MKEQTDMRELTDINLSEAIAEITQLKSELSQGSLDDVSFAVRLKGVFWYLKAAWNGRRLTLDDCSKTSSEEFDQLGVKSIEFFGINKE